MDRQQVLNWVAEYERLWRTPGTDRLVEIFTPDATYRQSPFREPVIGLAAIQRMWDEERDTAYEEFEMTAAVLAVEDDTAVVRAHVRYGAPRKPEWQEWLDLWVIRYAADGRCRAFEEWPFAPAKG
jgi:ketosteroid isomerase-like protein